MWTINHLTVGSVFESRLRCRGARRPCDGHLEWSFMAAQQVSPSFQTMGILTGLFCIRAS
jgi:hypothetical protein